MAISSQPRVLRSFVHSFLALMAPISHWMIYARTPFGMRRHRRSKRNGASVAVPANDGEEGCKNIE